MSKQHTDCGGWQARILLAASGELAEADARVLDEHIQLCRECRAFSADLGQISKDMRDAMPAGPPDHVLRAIHQVATEAQRPRAISFPVQLRVALGAAAALAIAVGVALREPRPTTPVVASDDAPEQIASLVWVLGDGELDTSAGEQVESFDAGTEKDDAAMRQLARKLLEMQGFGDDFTDEDALFPELPSTDLQSRNTSVSRDRKCV